MKKARFLLIMLMLTCSFFLTGCDAEKIMQTITQVAEGIKQAAPAIKQTIETVQGIFGNSNNNNTENATNNTANAPADQTATNDNASVTMVPSNDQEEIAANADATKLLNEVRYGVNKLKEKLDANASAADLQATIDWTNQWLERARQQKVEISKAILDYYEQLLTRAKTKTDAGNANANQGNNNSGSDKTEPDDDSTTTPVRPAASGSMQQRIVQMGNTFVERYSRSGSFPYLPETNNGRLGCAQLVNTIFEEAGYPIFPNSSGSNYYGRIRVTETAAKLKQMGWVEVTPPPYQAGDVITWNTGGGPDSHIGIIMTSGNSARALSNSSTHKKPLIHSAGSDYAPRTRLLRKPS